MHSAHDLRLLLGSRQPLVVIDTVEEDRAVELVDAAAARLEVPVFHWSITRGFTAADRPSAMNLTIVQPVDVLGHIASMRGPLVAVMKDLHHHLDAPLAVRALRECLDALQASRSTIVLIGAHIELPGELRHPAATIRLAPPDASELARTVAAVLEQAGARTALDAGQRREVIDSLRGLTRSQARQAVSAAIYEDGVLAPHDIPRLRDQKARLLADDGILEYHPSSDNAFALGGFDRLLAWVHRARQGFGERARALGVPPPRGVLLTGIPGCGKSLAAKVIARELGMSLLKLDAGALFNKYVGESERNLRRSLQIAQAMAPSVLWIDEIEKGLVPSGGGDTEGATARRMFGTFLTWMQEHQGQVFVVATANDVSALPPELMRKGRFDEVFFVDLPNAAERSDILGIHLRLRQQDPGDHDVARLVAATEGFTGAEIEAAIVGAIYSGLADGRDRVTTDAILTEIAATIPLSISRHEDLARIRSLAAGRWTPVSAPDRAAA